MPEVSVRVISKKIHPDLSRSALHREFKQILPVPEIYKETVSVFPGERIGHHFHLLKRCILICTKGKLTLYRQRKGGGVVCTTMSANPADGNHYCYAIIDPETTYLVTNSTTTASELEIWSDQPKNPSDNHELRIVL
ncbi:hypothetical protein CO173_02010 [Candidatus Uhrbacteria bacterium CG_4_9_14_3_um_filter_41_35]|uniref:Sugar 3,4-ketoisomerase QdtA cupin domain-containing protein n=1 Tax=Candidatus Uhrbacteria bacterium CG_4_9_14_3_um_filter_41_35 TaxID=1975034 RepID=A0A2M7XF83_9BACT|nr:MAG: hypothetical protein COV92_00250 [Candidatus Uhrbacteria bacterium CG11_big_fil_rev_8_21_14_0_20_41_9]PJA46518.1 MAG: hypothetical protein CO173_02010 [Candidatus Uhrbacteria bacterium CG_4_9_14_3_um_filter_41_35]